MSSSTRATIRALSPNESDIPGRNASAGAVPGLPPWLAPDLADIAGVGNTAQLGPGFHRVEQCCRKAHVEASCLCPKFKLHRSELGKSRCDKSCSRKVSTSSLVVILGTLGFIPLDHLGMHVAGAHRADRRLPEFQAEDE